MLVAEQVSDVLLRVSASSLVAAAPQSCGIELVDATEDSPKLTAEDITSSMQFKSRSKRPSFCVEEVLQSIPKRDFA